MNSLDSTGRAWDTSYGAVFDPTGPTRQAGAPNLALLTDGRLVCTFSTNEDTTEQLWEGYRYDLHADIKAVVSSDWGGTWSPSVRVVSQRDQGRFASWSGLARLRDDGLLCLFSDGPRPPDWNWEEVRCTRAFLRPAMFADHFDDGDARGWSPQSGTWWVGESNPGVRDTWYFGCDPNSSSALTLTGLSRWKDYEISADFLWHTEEAGIVFHATDAYNFYYFCVSNNGGDPLCRVYKLLGGSPQLLKGRSIAYEDQIGLRMTRMKDKYICYAGGALVEFEDSAFDNGLVGLRIKTPGGAGFDNVAVNGANAFLDPNTGIEAPLIGDPFNHLSRDGTPFMWGLLGAWQMALAENHGKVIKGTKGSFGEAMAFRGESRWTDYFVQADVELTSPSARAGVCLRVSRDATEWPPDCRCYQCYLDAAQAKFVFGVWWWRPETYQWQWGTLRETSFSQPSDWHTIAVEARGSQFHCYLDGTYRFTANSSTYVQGMVGLRVREGSALFDNVVVRDLRQ